MASLGDENAVLNAVLNAPPPAQEAETTSKRPRRESSRDGATRAAANGGVQRVLDVEMLFRNLLALLDLASLASFVEVLATSKDWCAYLTLDTLWRELLHSHFRGNLPPAEQLNDEEAPYEEEEEEEEEE
ncbi:hypothetical protein BBJ28_00026427, partial [Nothophytophthora sp. Chile5]